MKLLTNVFQVSRFRIVLNEDFCVYSVQFDEKKSVDCFLI